MKRNRASIRKAYRNALLDVFGCGDKEIDSDLTTALKKDIHLGGKDPGQWGDHALLSVYCESGIPNASDINDFSCYAAEFECDPSEMVSYNSDKWGLVDDIVNLLLEATGQSIRVHHEPVNGAVVNVYER